MFFDIFIVFGQETYILYLSFLDDNQNKLASKRVRHLFHVVVSNNFSWPSLSPEGEEREEEEDDVDPIAWMQVDPDCLHLEGVSKGWNAWKMEFACQVQVLGTSVAFTFTEMLLGKALKNFSPSYWLKTRLDRTL